MELQNNINKKRMKKKQSYFCIEVNITEKQVCSSQAFELAATTERLQVGGGYATLTKTSYEFEAC